MELTWIPASLRVFAWLLIGLALYVLYLALTKPKTRNGKAVWSLVVIAVSALFMFGPRLAGLSQRGKAEAAMAHFEMRCKSAGEKINRTIENVDGVVWMKWRDKSVNFSDQFKLDDPFGHDCGAEKCLEQLLRATKGLELDPENKQHARNGYQFAETIEPQSQEPRRYIRQLYREKDRDPKYADWAINSEVVFEHITKPTARYGITWDDVSTREDREKWVAGGSLKVIDLQTNEVIAERTGYMVDLGQGSESGGRSPWLLARRTACPSFPAGMHRYPAADNVLFTLKVLKPTEEK
jgi:hypothetical protein